MRRFRRRLKLMVEKRLRTYYSAGGEDIILRQLFDSVGIDHPDYIDIGANSPVGGNNTYLFYRDGSRGVCVEPNPVLAREIAGFRPRDTSLSVAVGVDGPGSIDLYVFDPSGLSTTDADEAKRRERSGKYKVVEILKVPVETIDAIISMNFDTYPDILSLDVEGLDLAVLQSLDFDNYPIPAICVETVAYTEGHVRAKETETIDYLVAQGYFLYADTYINSILVNDRWYRQRSSARDF